MSLTNEDKQWILDNVADKVAESSATLAAAIERVETSLLTEFHKWAGPRPGATTERATYPG